MTDFNGHKALITGATRGIGKAVASAFLKADATVIGIYSSDLNAAEAFMEEWKADHFFSGRQAIPAPLRCVGCIRRAAILCRD